jgi:RNA polymerase sigma-70 factor (ECF subfamily)
VFIEGTRIVADLRSETQELINRAQRGEVAARHRLLAIYRDYLRRMVAVRLDRRLASRVDPSDVVQEALVEADRRFDAYLRELPVPFHAWLRQLAGDRIVDAHRRHVASHKRSVTLEAEGIGLPQDSSHKLVRLLGNDDTTPSDRLIRKESQERIHAAIAALPAKDREVLVMRHLEQLGTAEIAGILGINEGAVKARLLRALIRLRAQLGIGS